MDEQQIFNVVFSLITGLFAVLGAIAAWIFTNLWSWLRGQQKQINELSIHLAQQYVPRAEMQNNFDRVFAFMEDIRREMRLHKDKDK